MTHLQHTLILPSNPTVPSSVVRGPTLFPFTIKQFSPAVDSTLRFGNRSIATAVPSLEQTPASAKYCDKYLTHPTNLSKHNLV